MSPERRSRPGGWSGSVARDVGDRHGRRIKARSTSSGPVDYDPDKVRPGPTVPDRRQRTLPARLVPRAGRAREAAEDAATRKGVTVSELAREALERYLAS